MKVISIKEIEYDDFIYTPQVEDNHNYLFNNGILSKNCQNFSKKSLKTVLTRLDSTCKVVCIGSNRQIDNNFINKYTNGLNFMLKAANEKHEEVKMFATSLHKVERGAITAFAERILK